MELKLDRVESPIGIVLLATDERSVVSLDFEEYEARFAALLTKRFGSYRLTPAPDPLGASTLVRAYFAGTVAALDALPVDTGGTAFQRSVWLGLRTIPSGTVMSYGALASQLGVPKASRAVGYANSLNPIAIALPCHRVVGADRSLTGYAGGLERKRWLLAHEGAMI
ncbi:MAG TPA: methylated-DNA--[protein]-cysteine S-methyltransferase [Aliidongia sp.]|nr:methylated-DNA--[protein]-cysteine S-methyltransferase [Aliidongia sp.]